MDGFGKRGYPIDMLPGFAAPEVNRTVVPTLGWLTQRSGALRVVR